MFDQDLFKILTFAVLAASGLFFAVLWFRVLVGESCTIAKGTGEAHHASFTAVVLSFLTIPVAFVMFVFVAVFTEVLEPVSHFPAEYPQAILLLIPILGLVYVASAIAGNWCLLKWLIRRRNPSLVLEFF